ncbi:MAG: class I SAM-dependent methyltransferase [Magnetococcales bacterium]|nr:class I SAM-dependent methyltransferase [Magnetococcales bacterium]
MDRKAHWDKAYSGREADSWSWFQGSPTVSLGLIKACGLAFDASIIDVGGGGSTLTGELLGQGFTALSVLDISSTALEKSRERLDAAVAGGVTWIESDITGFSTDDRFDLWHDRAVFHFLTDAGDREKYREILFRHLKPGGFLVVSTFAVDGPKKCSGLDIVGNDAQSLHKALGGDRLQMLESREEEHVTPKGGKQKFIYVRLQRV